MANRNVSSNNHGASKECIPMQHLMVELLWDGVEHDVPERLQTHIKGCDACRIAFQDMQHTVQLLPPSPDTELPEAYWEAFTQRVINEAAREKRSPSTVSLMQQRLQTLWDRVGNRQFFPRLGFALALIFAGVFIGRMWDAPIDPRIMPDIEQASTEMIAPAQLTERTRRYLDRSSVLLLGLVNFDVGADDPAVIHMDRKRTMAAELVDEARVLRADLNAGREQQLAQLIEDLERILIQIANLEAREDVPSIELIQRGVDHGSLLLKINLEQMRLGDRAAEQSTPLIPDAGAIF